MVFLKGFLRKKKTNIFIVILSALLTSLFLINSFYNNYKTLYDGFMNEHSDFILFSQEDYTDQLTKEQSVESFIRALDFEIIDYNIEESSDTLESIYDNLKISSNTILAFPDSYCKVKLKKNEIVLAMPNFELNKDAIKKHINQNINFKHNTKKINLSIKDIIEAKATPYTCVSEQDYNEFLKEETNNIYSLNIKTYYDANELEMKWDTSDYNGSVKIIHNTYLKENDTNDYRYYTELIDDLKLINIISSIIIFFVLIFAIKDLINEEEKDILMLKELGFKSSIINLITFEKIILLDIIITFISIAVSIIISSILNNLCNISLKIVTYELFIFIFIILIIELIFIVIRNKKI